MNQINQPAGQNGERKGAGEMAVKMIAVDMDGTFLDDNKQYNVQRFSRQYALLKQKGIRFVVASGNQYYQLQRYFPDIKDEIAFVAENGAWVSDSNEEIFCGELAQEKVHKILDILAHEPDIAVVVCGRNGGALYRQRQPTPPNSAFSASVRLAPAFGAESLPEPYLSCNELRYFPVISSLPIICRVTR